MACSGVCDLWTCSLGRCETPACRWVVDHTVAYVDRHHRIVAGKRKQSRLRTNQCALAGHWRSVPRDRIQASYRSIYRAGNFRQADHGVPAAYLSGRWIALALFIGGLPRCVPQSVLSFGLETVLDYVRAKSRVRGGSTPWLHTEWVNQSLLSTLLRQADAEVPVSQAIWYPPFLLVGGAVGALSTWLAWRLARNGDKLTLSLLLSAALLLYPGVLKPYGMLMLIPLVQVE